MDIHRCRFVPFPTSPINTLAFNRPYISPTEKSQKSIPVRLAIGRENGDIEIWNPLEGVWHQEAIMHGGAGRKTDAVVWATEPDVQLGDGGVAFGRSRLFSIGGGSTVTEWDLAKARARKHASGQHGEIWCLGLQPAPPGQSSSRLVAGTGDGCLVLYSIEDDDLRLQRILVKSPSKKVHFVSLVFQSRHVVAVGCSDASIRVYDVRNGSMVRKMTLGRDLAGPSKDIIVWCVKCLPNGDIVSGDSTGQVCIWDGKTYTQAQRIQSHSQDVLSLSISANGSAIISGGMDKKTVLYKRLVSQNSRWSKVFHRRYHSHDVKALAVFEGRGMSAVVSGGSDSSPVVIPLKEAGLENHRTLPHLPQSVPILSAPQARILVSWWGREVQVWKLPQRSSSTVAVDGEPDRQQSPRVLKKILIKGTSNITSASISADGCLLAVSTVAELKLFQLTIEPSGADREELRVTRVDVPAHSVSKAGASLVQVSPNGKWICLVREGTEVTILKIRMESHTGQLCIDPVCGHRPLQRLHRDHASQSTFSGLGSYPRHITHIAFAPDSMIVATADLSGYIDTWLLRDDMEREVAGGCDDAHALRGSPQSRHEATDAASDDESSVDDGRCSWVSNPKGSLIPKLPSAATVLSFSGATPSSRAVPGDQARDYELLAVTSSSRLFIFDPIGGSLTRWSRQNPYAKFPEAFRTSRDIIKGALWQGSRLWLYGTSSLFMLDLSRDLSPEHSHENTSRRQRRGMKRKRDSHVCGAGDRMDTGTLDASRVQKAIVGHTGTDEWLDMETDDVDEARHNMLDQDEEEDSDGGELQAMRADHAMEDDELKETSGGVGCWHTFKYRPILGAVPLESSGPNTADKTVATDMHQQNLEIALVERPLWDGLPPRFVAEDERDERGAREYP